MRTIQLKSLNDFDEWRGIARSLLRAGTAPEAVIWLEPSDSGGLFDAADLPEDAGQPAGAVPAAFLRLAETVLCHADPERFALLYRVLWRLQTDRSLLGSASDPDVAELESMARAVRRDMHKMTAFVRFRAVPGDDGVERFAAWFEPEHYILERTVGFFERRFSSMFWLIVTPYRSAVWNGKELALGPGGNKADVPGDDALEETWRTYFKSIFNPARLKVSMMKSEMPLKYWRNLPEAELIPSLIRGAKQAEAEMIERMATLPPSRHLRQQGRQENERVETPAEIVSLADARAQVQGCRRCPLYEHATQAVFGEGPKSAEIMFVGEQPGDQEDLAGRPFVGPAGQVFDQSMEKAGIDRSAVYVTNAVKHFKFEPRGKRRIHQKPNSGEISACKFWLNLEREFVRPKLIVALGATAAQSLTGRPATISKLRGAPLKLEDGTWLYVTVHPSYLLRIPDRAMASFEREKFVQDLVAIKDFAASLDEAALVRKAG